MHCAACAAGALRCVVRFDGRQLPAQDARTERSAEEGDEPDRRHMPRGDEQERILRAMDRVEGGAHASGEQAGERATRPRPARRAMPKREQRSEENWYGQHEHAGEARQRIIADQPFWPASRRGASNGTE